MIVIGDGEFADFIKNVIDYFYINDVFVLFGRFDIFAYKLSDFENGLFTVDFLHAFLDEFKGDDFLELEILEKEVIGLVDIKVLFGHEPAPHKPFEPLVVLFGLELIDIFSVQRIAKLWWQRGRFG